MSDFIYKPTPLMLPTLPVFLNLLRANWRAVPVRMPPAADSVPAQNGIYRFRVLIHPERGLEQRRQLSPRSALRLSFPGRTISTAPLSGGA